MGEEIMEQYLNKIINGDCLEVLKTLPNDSIDSIVTDPPAGIGFMGKEWDDFSKPKNTKSQVVTWMRSGVKFDNKGRESFIDFMTQAFTESLRVLKPGGHALVWALPRTSHWTGTALENAGFEVRDKIYFLFGSGFPKSLDIKKSAIKQDLACNCQIDGIELEHEETIARPNLPSMPETISSENSDSFVKGEKMQSEVLWNMESKQSGDIGSSKIDSPKRKRKTKDRQGIGGSEEPSLEGRDNLLSQEGILPLHENKISALSEGVSTDGEEGRLHNGTQTDNGSALKTDIATDGSSASQKSQPTRQQDRELGVISEQSRTQASGKGKTCKRCGKPILPDGFGTALKPATEEWILCRKPISESNVALNFIKHGTGGINIDESRIGIEERFNASAGNKAGGSSLNMSVEGMPQNAEGKTAIGRFPANLIHDGSDVILAEFAKAGESKSPKTYIRQSDGFSTGNSGIKTIGEQVGKESLNFGDEGSPARFFYTAKPSSAEKNLMYGEFEEKERFMEGNYSQSPTCKTCNLTLNGTNNHTKCSGEVYYKEMTQKKMGNTHPTVKAQSLMQYLIKLITPPKGIVLDMFAGSGSTLLAAKSMGHPYIGIELNPEYIEIAEARLKQGVLDF